MASGIEKYVLKLVVAVSVSDMDTKKQLTKPWHITKLKPSSQNITKPKPALKIAGSQSHRFKKTVYKASYFSQNKVLCAL